MAPWRVLVLIQVGVASLHKLQNQTKNTTEIGWENLPHLTRSPQETMGQGFELPSRWAKPSGEVDSLLRSPTKQKNTTEIDGEEKSGRISLISQGLHRRR